AVRVILIARRPAERVLDRGRTSLAKVGRNDRLLAECVGHRHGGGGSDHAAAVIRGDAILRHRADEMGRRIVADAGGVRSGPWTADSGHSVAGAGEAPDAATGVGDLGHACGGIRIRYTRLHRRRAHIVIVEGGARSLVPACRRWSSAEIGRVSETYPIAEAVRYLRNSRIVAQQRVEIGIIAPNPIGVGLLFDVNVSPI